MKSFLHYKILVVIILILSAALRGWLLYTVHFPYGHLNGVADGGSYVEMAYRLVNGLPQLHGDTTWAPGTTVLLSFLIAVDPYLKSALLINLLMSLSICIGFGLVGYVVGGRNVSLFCLSLSGIFLPHIHYMFYFTSETPSILTTTLGIFLTYVLFNSKKLNLVAVISYGSMWALLTAFKSQGLIFFLGLNVSLLIVFAFKKDWKNITKCLMACVLYALLITPLFIRCGQLNRIGYCPVAINGPANAAIGFSGKDKLVFRNADNKPRGPWFPPSKRAEWATFDAEKRVPLSLDIKFTDSGKILGWIVNRFKEKPVETFLTIPLRMWYLFDANTSVLPIYVRFKGAVPFLTWGTILFIFIPSLLGLYKLKSTSKDYTFIISLILMLGLFGIHGVSLGETRYRFSYDAVLFALAGVFYFQKTAAPLTLNIPLSFHSVFALKTVAATVFILFACFPGFDKQRGQFFSSLRNKTALVEIVLTTAMDSSHKIKKSMLIYPPSNKGKLPLVQSTIDPRKDHLVLVFKKGQRVGEMFLGRKKTTDSRRTVSFMPPKETANKGYDQVSIIEL